MSGTLFSGASVWASAPRPSASPAPPSARPAGPSAPPGSGTNCEEPADLPQSCARTTSEVIEVFPV